MRSDQGRYVLNFISRDGKWEEIGRFEESSVNEAINNAFKMVSDDCKKKGFQVFYTRAWEEKSRMVIDYGSHVSFYYLYPYNVYD